MQLTLKNKCNVKSNLFKQYTEYTICESVDPLNYVIYCRHDIRADT